MSLPFDGRGTASLTKEPSDAPAVVEAPPRGESSRDPWLIATVVAVAAFGLLLRVWLLGRQSTGEAEAIAGVMGRQISHGHFFAFFFGQNYGGAEPYAEAVVFRLFGTSDFTLGLTPVLLDVVAAILLWRVATRLFGRLVGIVAALVFWTWPAVYVAESTHEFGFRYAALVCGLVVMLEALRIGQGPRPLEVMVGTDANPRLATREPGVRPALDWFLLGLFAGIGWWATPEILYYLVPAGIYLAWMVLRHDLQVRAYQVVLALGAATVGALPWIWVNVHTRLGSIRDIPSQPDPSYTSHVSKVLTHIVPTVMGLRLDTANADWLYPSSGSPVPVIGEIIFGIVAVALVYWILILFRRGQGVMVGIGALLFTLICALSPYAWDPAARYGLLLTPIMSALFASVAVALLMRTNSRRLIGLVLAAALLAFTAALAVDTPQTPYPSRANQAQVLSWQANPNSNMARLASDLNQLGIHEVWASYWISWMLEWESGGHITSSDVRKVDYQPYYAAVANSGSAAWLFASPGQATKLAFELNLPTNVLDPGCILSPGFCVNLGDFATYLSASHIGFRAVEVNGFTAVIPQKPIPLKAMAALSSYEPTASALKVSSAP